MSSDLYGAMSQDLEKVRTAVEESIGCKMSPHDSSYHGDYFRAELMNGETIIAKRNVDLMDGKPAESKFPNYPTLVYVSGTARSREIELAFRKARPTLKLLSRT